MRGARVAALSDFDVPLSGALVDAARVPGALCARDERGAAADSAVFV